ncbi:hypothetical protein BT67DRAFT_64683 [Trichocladium antarcticum]|uniref:Uncharacterized protein n=1 Tax=Trichocladium antarcticum TaxID=1450529 RepID=A0AAN6ZC69_9PEZI|nr:hypothetical protein BT67DRAFT_64683 [Trichocladium antarcticum]
MPTKRKTKEVQATSPKRPPPARSTRASKGSPATDGNEQDDFHVLPKPAKRARGAAARAAKADEDLDDDFEHVGPYPNRRASKPATVEQHLMDQNKKSKEFIQSFREQVASRQDHLHETLAKFKQELAQSRPAQNDDLAGIYTALQTAAAAKPLSIKDNPLFAQTQQLLRLSRAILDCHQKADRDLRGAQLQLGSPREAWKRDEEGMRKLLECGRAYGERVVEGWISPEEGGAEDDNDEGEVGDRDDGEEFDEGMMREAENLARGLFESEGRKGGETWGVAARKQMAALAGVVGTLPARKGGE